MPDLRRPAAHEQRGTQESPAPREPVDRDAYAAFYHTWYARLAAQLSAYLGSTAEAEDVVQEAFLRAWQRWQKIDGYDEPASWVRRVAWNLATSRWRRVVREAKLLRLSSARETAVLQPENVALVAALRQIPPRHRQVIVLHYLADLPVADIAADLSVPRGTVLSWLHRGRAQLAVLLADTDQPGRV